jgi:hypothetical protein
MTKAAIGPLSRPIRVDRLVGAKPANVDVEATPAECAALAADFKIPAIRDLKGLYRLTGSLARLKVVGTVQAVVTQVCTVTLDEFESFLNLDVDIDYSDGAESLGVDPESLDVPDPIVKGQIDFGALTAETVALGLDPFPRKPGAVFEPVTVGEDESPFAVLKKPTANDD